MVGNRTMLSIAQEICPKAKAVICAGTCSSYGGIAAAYPNPTGAKGVKAALPNLTVPVVNVPGCPPNPVNVVGVIADYLLQNRLPALDSKGRPRFAYGRKVHELCPYREQESAASKSKAARASAASTTARASSSTTGSASPCRPVIPASAAANPTSGHDDAVLWEGDDD